MFQCSESDASASPVSGAIPSSSLSTPLQYGTVRHMVFGSVAAVRTTIKRLHSLNYAEPNDWSKLVPTGQPNEVVAVLTKKVRV